MLISIPTLVQAYSVDGDYSSQIEKEIRADNTTSADLIVNYHPRIWLRGGWDWNKNNTGSFAWRIAHGAGCANNSASCDDMKNEFYYVSGRSDNDMYGNSDDIYARRYLWSIFAAEGVARKAEWNLPYSLPGTTMTYNPQHSEDELLSDAKAKLLVWVDEYNDYVGAHAALHGAAGYDWLVDRYYSDGTTPVLSEAERIDIQGRLIELADKMKADCQGQGQLLGRSDHIFKYFYPIIGIALYEPDGIGISTGNNNKAKGYLDDFDTYWVGKILPALNEQGGTGGWHAGLCYIGGQFPSWGYYGEGTQNDVLPYRAGPLLYAHYTATGQSFENSIYNTGFLKYSGEFWNYMIYPDGNYDTISEDSGGRYDWIGPMFSHSRRRFSSNAYDQWAGELIGWVRNEKAPDAYVNGGSYCMFDQLMFEQKWPDARSPNALGCSTRHFAKLGWVAMRSGFTSPDDLAALFICQRYHWSDKNPYSQNSFHIMRKGWLIEGNSNTIYIDNEYQRTISNFPTVAQGVGAYSSGSTYDVGPGIIEFQSNDNFDYIKGDATNAYDSSKLSRFTRQLIYLKPSIFIIFDKVVTTDSSIEKKWVVDPGAAPQDAGNNIITITNGDGALWVKRLLPTSASVTLSDSQIAIVPTQPTTETYFLNVMEAVDGGSGSSEVSADDATVTQDGDWFHVQVAGSQVSFSINDDFDIDNGPPSSTPPEAPIGVSPKDEAIFNETETITLSASSFSDPDGDSHAKTYWQVRREDNDALVYEKISTIDLTEHIITTSLRSGLKYIWKVGYEDSNGDVSWSEEYTFKVGTYEAASLPQIYAGADIDDYQMISFAHWPDDPMATSVIRISYNSSNHKIGTYDTTIGGYIEYGSSLLIKPGRAYWVLAREGLTVNYEGVPVSLSTYIDVSLSYNTNTGSGWNMVACPNAADYVWTDVEIVEFDANGNIVFGPTAISALSDPNEYINLRLWQWDNGSYDDSTTIMEKYKGYWVKAKKANLYLRFPVSAQADIVNSKTMFAGFLNRSARWLGKLIQAPEAATADSNDSPPMPMGALSNNTTEGGGGCFITTTGYGAALVPRDGLAPLPFSLRSIQ